MKELQPLNDNVLLDITYTNSEQRTKTGIIIPDTAKEDPEYAEVISVGKSVDVDISVGDTVYFKKYSGTEFEFEDKKYLVIPYGDLIAKVVDLEQI